MTCFLRLTLKASRISSSESVSFIFRAIMVRNSDQECQSRDIIMLDQSYRRTREVDGAIVVGVNLVDHVLKLGLGRVLAEGAHNSTKLLGGDLAWIDTLVADVMVNVSIVGGCGRMWAAKRFA